MTANPIDRTASRDGLLRLAMCADAIISGLWGVLGLTGWILPFDGAPEAFRYGTAACFTAYGAIVLMLAVLPSVRRAGIGVIVANLLYTAVAVVLVLVDVFSLTPTAVVSTLASGLYTLVFATLQYLGWRRASITMNSGAPR